MTIDWFEAICGDLQLPRVLRTVLENWNGQR